MNIPNKKQSKKVIFMHITIKNSGANWLHQYAKLMALYQYIPPTSCHPPGTLIGLAFHQVLQIFQLCSRSQDINLELAPSTTVSWNTDTRQLASWPFLSRSFLTIPTTAFLSPKLIERKQRRLGRVMQMREYFSIFLFTHQTPILRCYPASLARSDSVGNLPEGYIRNVPLPRVPRDQSTFQSRVPPVHTIPVYYEEKHVLPTYNSTCRIGERVATANSPQWQPIAINT